MSCKVCSQLASLLTKAVGDITALLIATSQEDRIADYTSGYVAAINAHDAPCGLPRDLVEVMAKAMYEADDVWHVAFPWPACTELGKADGYRLVAKAAIKAHREYMASADVVQADRQLLSMIAVGIEWGATPEHDLKMIADFRRAAAMPVLDVPSTGMALEIALDFADHPRPYHSLAAPADDNGELYEALKVIAAAYRGAIG